MLSVKRDAKAAQRLFMKVLKGAWPEVLRVVYVDKNPAYPSAVEDLKVAGAMWDETELSQVKYLDNLIEQVHRFIKRRKNPGLGFGSFKTARRTTRGYESMNMIRKGQIKDIPKGDVIGQSLFIHKIFGLAV